MKRTASLLGAAVLALAFSASSIGVAHADPYDCRSYPKNQQTWAGICTNGTGMYRVKVTCQKRSLPGEYTLRGNPERIGTEATATCDSRYDARNGSIEIFET